VTCSISKETRVAVTGSSGSGKSTLLHLLAGLDAPTAGTICWPGLGGHPLADPGRVGLVFQGQSLLPALTVTENVALPLLLGDSPERQAHARAMEALALLEIGDLQARLPEELSGGQAQRVAVARVLAAGPALILADEPTGQLDHDTAATVIDALLTACEEHGAALIVSTHDPLIAARLPEQWPMSDGALSESAAVVR
jgi:ABC-type lipoprotein export system ATPase subunit